MIIEPTDAATDFPEVATEAALFAATDNVRYDAGLLRGVRSREDHCMMAARYLGLRNALVVVGDAEVVYMTADWRYIRDAYPKAWPYAKYACEGSEALEIDVAQFPRHRLDGAYFMPFFVAGNWFHGLFDNYARLSFLETLHAAADLTIGLPSWAAPETAEFASDRALIHSIFLAGRRWRGLEKGIYEVERLILPPLANISDYIFTDPLHFVARTLRGTLTPRAHRFTHRNRLFISRADIEVRNLANEAALADALRQRGFMIICPGDYSFRTQLELFASAEIVVGVHGQGMVALICAQNCRAFLEFEASGWAFTAYRSMADSLGIPYYKLPCEIVSHRDSNRFDWTAEADLPACLAAIDAVIGNLPLMV